MVHVRSRVLIAGASPEFQSLINGLLQKDPYQRLTWDELAHHPFWKDALESLPLPCQPRWENDRLNSQGIKVNLSNLHLTQSNLCFLLHTGEVSSHKFGYKEALQLENL